MASLPNPLSEGEVPWKLMPASVSSKLTIFSRTTMPIYIKETSANVFDKNICLPKKNHYLIVTEGNDKRIFKNGL